MAKNGPDFKAAKRAKIKVPIEAEFERRAALPSSGSHYVRWEESVCGVGGWVQPSLILRLTYVVWVGEPD